VMRLSPQKCLVIVQSSLRAFDITGDNRMDVGLRDIEFDIAYCGVEGQPLMDYSQFKYVWEHNEEPNLDDFLRRSLPRGVWEMFLNPQNSRGFSTTELRHQLWISGLIQNHYRRLAMSRIIEEGLRSKYSWFIFIRSDYFFTLPLPDFRKQVQNRIFFFEGERYGGICDRFLAVPSEMVESVAKIYDFGGARLEIELEKIREALIVSPYKNPETLLHQRLVGSKLIEKSFSIPQRGFCVRGPADHSRWTSGYLSSKRRLYVKYPTELALSKVATIRFVVFKFFRIRRLDATKSSRKQKLHVRVIDWACGDYKRRLAPILLLLGELSFTLSMVGWKTDSSALAGAKTE
jgi:hypothetical protein